MAQIDDIRRQLDQLKKQGKTPSNSKRAGKLAKQFRELKASGDRGGGGGAAALEAGSRARESEFLGRFKGALAAQPSISDIFKRLSEEAGLGGLRERAQQLGGRFRDITSEVAGTAKRFGLSASQQRQRIAGRQEKLQPALQQALSAQQFGERGVLEGVGFAQADLEKQLRPFQTEREFITEGATRALTGFTVERQAEATELIQKLKNQGSLSDIEAQKLADLSVQEDLFTRQRDEAIRKANLDGGANFGIFSNAAGTQTPFGTAFQSQPGGNFQGRLSQEALKFVGQ